MTVTALPPPPPRSLLGDRVLDLNSNNFLTWNARIEKILNNLDFPGSHRVVPPLRYSRYGEWMQCSVQAADMIKALVTERLLAQVDRRAQRHHFKLLDKLQALVFTFRFLDMPPELRNRVYEHSFAGRAIVFLAFSKSRTYTQADRAPRFPAVTAVSRQVRKESLSLCYSYHRFMLNLAIDKDTMDLQQKKAVNLGAHARSWARCLSAPDIKHIRSLTVSLIVRGRRDKVVYLDLKLDPLHGLHYGLYWETTDAKDERLTIASAAVLADYIGEVEETRKMLDLKGEALVMAMTGKDGIWKYGTLKC